MNSAAAWRAATDSQQLAGVWASTAGLTGMDDQKLWQRELLRARTMAGLTQEQLAVRSGLCTRTICELENGRAVPRESTLRLVSRALEMSPTETSRLMTSASAHRRRAPARTPVM